MLGWDQASGLWYLGAECEKEPETCPLPAPTPPLCPTCPHSADAPALPGLDAAHILHICYNQSSCSPEPGLAPTWPWPAWAADSESHQQDRRPGETQAPHLGTPTQPGGAEAGPGRASGPRVRVPLCRLRRLATLASGHVHASWPLVNVQTLSCGPALGPGAPSFQQVPGKGRC